MVWYFCAFNTSLLEIWRILDKFWVYLTKLKSELNARTRSILKLFPMWQFFHNWMSQLKSKSSCYFLVSWDTLDILLLPCFNGYPGYFATVMFHGTPGIFCYCQGSLDTRDILLLSCFMGHPGYFATVMFHGTPWKFWLIWNIYNFPKYKSG